MNKESSIYEYEHSNRRNPVVIKKLILLKIEDFNGKLILEAFEAIILTKFYKNSERK